MEDPLCFLNSPYESFDWYEVSVEEEKWTSWQNIVQERIRQKGIDKGKGLRDYQIYSKTIPKEARRPCHPVTPDIKRKFSRKQWEREVRQWKISVHQWVDKNSSL